MAKLELGIQEIDRVVDPEGWIGKAFDVLSNELQETRQEFHCELEGVNAKLDAILQRLTGTHSSEDL